MAAPASGLVALDLASGTGDIALRWPARRRVTASRPDASHAAARAREDRAGGVAFVTGDMMAFPFPGRLVRLAVTTGYGLRNVPSIDRPSRRSTAC